MASRVAQVPGNAFLLDYVLSKADLLEVAWHLASLVNDAGSCDDDESTLARILQEAHAVAGQQGRKVGNLRARYNKMEKALEARRAEYAAKASDERPLTAGRARPILKP